MCVLSRGEWSKLRNFCLGAGKVRGRGWVALCGRRAASADMTVCLCGGEEKREGANWIGWEEAGSVLFLFSSYFTQCMDFFSLITSVQLLLVTELIVN